MLKILQHQTVIIKIYIFQAIYKHSYKNIGKRSDSERVSCKNSHEIHR